jgi:RNA polymerase sigma-70 factor (ECF subfamily)
MSNQEFQDHVLPLKNKLFAYAFSLLEKREEARDTVQDVMLKIWEEKKVFSEYRSIEAWCMTLTRNRALDRIKRKDWRQEDVSTMYSLKNSAEDPLSQLEKKDALEKIRLLMKGLPEKQREIMFLRDFQEHSYDEIAEILQIEMSKVKVYLHRARKFIKVELKKMNYHNVGS